MTTASPLDAPLLVFLGMVCAVAYRRWLYYRNEDWFIFLGIAAVGILWFSLISTVLADVQPLTMPTVETGSLILAVFYALSYPFWFWIGGWIIFLFFGRRPEQGGVYWLYQIEDRTDEFEPSWER